MDFENVSGKIVRDRYQIIDILGRGGIGITYAAIDLQTKEKIALKAVSLQQLTDWKQVELLSREASVLAQLNHPAIPKYLNYFHIDSEDDRTFYIVQQLAPGKSLFQLVESGRRSNETKIKKIITQILDIFIYLHSLNPPVIHRDIKPHNLILGDDGKIFLVDFGAVQNTYYNTLMQGSTVVGTYGYMAPEQFKGKATPATDLYGLGATILYLLTHRSPNELPQDTLTINFRSSVNISEGFAIWLEKILQPDLEDRFSSAKEALNRLSDRYLFTKAFTNKWKVALNLSLVGASAIPGIVLFNSYKWAILTSLAYYPSGFCSSSKIVEDYLQQGGKLSIDLLDKDPQSQFHNTLFKCIFDDYKISLDYKVKLVKFLINKGADVNAKDSDGRTPLMETEDLEIAKLLIDRGAAIYVTDNRGRTSLMEAYNPGIAKLLLDKGTDVNAKDDLGNTPLSVLNERKIYN
jgi:serine/threonine protein kinase